MQTLHYLYENDGSGAQRFVYVCSNCDCVLRVRRDPGSVGGLLESLQGRCPSCGGSLEGASECRLAAIPESWSEIDLTPRQRRTAAPRMFSPASSLAHFSLSFPPLDRLLRPLVPGRLVVVEGDGASAVSELLAFRAQLPRERGGLDSPVLFVDGGNRSDPYLFASFARQHGVRPEDALRRVANCRLFTMYQVGEMVSRRLASAVRDYGAKLVVLADVLGNFNEPELDDREARRVLEAVGAGVEEVKGDALVVATLPSPNKYDGLVEPWADTLLGLVPAGRRVRASLLRHPAGRLGESDFRLADLLRAKG